MQKVEGSSPFSRSTAELARHPRLARVLLNSNAGQSIHSTRRSDRDRSIQAAIAEITDHLPDDQAAERAAIITHLCSSRSWITLQDETALDSAAARRAVAWALHTLTDELQRQHNATPPCRCEQRPAPCRIRDLRIRVGFPVRVTAARAGRSVAASCRA
jgi:hypothetical protein